MHRTPKRLFSAALVTILSVLSFAATSPAADQQWVVYDGSDGPGKGKHVVLISGDEEYRSEEALPQLGKILAKQHGFKATVLFPIDPKTGEINPEHRSNIPGLEALKDADLMIIATRFRDLPDEQMKHIVEYLSAGKPVIGMRTATHAFNIGKDKTYHQYSYNYGGKDYPQGFGRQVLGETWIAHHGAHGKESTRGLIAPEAKEHPITRGIKDGDIWGDTDVYTVRLPLPGDSKPIILGQVLKTMSRDSEPVTGNKKNDPMMPAAWTKTYKSESGREGRVFTTTMGSSTDLAAAGTRRMLVNAVYWALGMDDKIPAEGTKVDIVGTFNPTPFGFGKHKRSVKPEQHAME